MMKREIIIFVICFLNVIPNTVYYFVLDTQYARRTTIN